MLLSVGHFVTARPVDASLAESAVLFCRQQLLRPLPAELKLHGEPHLQPSRRCTTPSAPKGGSQTWFSFCLAHSRAFLSSYRKPATDRGTVFWHFCWSQHPRKPRWVSCMYKVQMGSHVQGGHHTCPKAVTCELYLQPRTRVTYVKSVFLPHFNSTYPSAGTCSLILVGCPNAIRDFFRLGLWQI